MSTLRGGQWCVFSCVVGAGTQGPLQEAPPPFWGSTEAHSHPPPGQGRLGLPGGGVRPSGCACGCASRSQMLRCLPGGQRQLPVGRAWSRLEQQSARPEAAADGVWPRAVLGGEGWAQANSEPSAAAPGPVGAAAPAAPPPPDQTGFTLISGLCVNSSSLVLTAGISNLVYLKIRNTPREPGAQDLLPHQLTDSRCELVQLKGGRWVFTKFSESQPNVHFGGISFGRVPRAQKEAKEAGEAVPQGHTGPGAEAPVKASVHGRRASPEDRTARRASLPHARGAFCSWCDGLGGLAPGLTLRQRTFPPQDRGENCLPTRPPPCPCLVTRHGGLGSPSPNWLGASCHLALVTSLPVTCGDPKALGSPAGLLPALARVDHQP